MIKFAAYQMRHEKLNCLCVTHCDHVTREVLVVIATNNILIKTFVEFGESHGLGRLVLASSHT